MPKRDTIPDGVPCWLDLLTRDKKQAMAFYGPLFGWTEWEGGEELGFYSSLFKGDDIVAGMNQKHEQAAEIPDSWTVYFQTSDVAATIAKAKAAGGQSWLDAVPVAGLGTMGVIGDPTGAALGLWQPNEHKGYALWGEHGAPGWFELATHDLDAAKRFYLDVFGNPVTDQKMGEGNLAYATIAVYGEDYAGLMSESGFLPDDAPSHWRVYFSVDDCREAVKQVQELGGTVHAKPDDSPYGTMATVADPFGATFLVISDDSDSQ